MPWDLIFTTRRPARARANIKAAHGQRVAETTRVAVSRSEDRILVSTYFYKKKGQMECFNRLHSTLLEGGRVRGLVVLSVMVRH